MRTSILHSFLLLVAVLVTGCASTGVKPVNPAVVAKMSAIDNSQTATMVIYRPSNFQGSALRPTVTLDGQDLINIGNGKVFVAPLRPGRHVFEMDDKKSGTEVNLKPGETVYLKIEIVPGFWKGGGKLTQVAPEQGQFESKRLDLIPVREIEQPEYR